jgi:hypothetical protein
MPEHMQKLPIETRSVEWQAMEQTFRKQVIGMASDALKVTIYRDLSKSEQIECLMAGMMTGLMCSCLAAVKPETYQIIEEYMARCVPVARANAEELLRKAGSI